VVLIIPLPGPETAPPKRKKLEKHSPVWRQMHMRFRAKIRLFQCFERSQPMPDQRPLPALCDAAGHVYLPENPQPGLVTVTVCAAELLELWAWHAHRAALAAETGNAPWWSSSEKAAAKYLALAVRLAPELEPMRRQPSGVTANEGKA
jgi:hypothetical protein